MDPREQNDADSEVPPRPEPPPNVIIRTGLKVPPTVKVRLEDFFPPVPGHKE